MEGQKVVIVNGATGYVGQAIARQLAQEGFHVALWYHRDTKAADELIRSLAGTGHHAYRVELTDEVEVQSALQKTQEEMGTPYASVHAAGVAPTRRKLIDSSAGAMKMQFMGNALAGFNFLVASARMMKWAGSGVLIGITTEALNSSEAGKGLGPYVPAKAALRSVIQFLKDELVSSNVRVEEIAPSFIDGGMNASLPRAFVQLVREKSPGKKLMTAEDVAQAISAILAPNALGDP